MTCCKLDILHTKAAEITAHLGRCLEEEVLKLCDVIADILSAEETDEQLREWDIAELPQPPSSGAKVSRVVGLTSICFVIPVTFFKRTVFYGHDVLLMLSDGHDTKFL